MARHLTITPSNLYRVGNGVPIATLGDDGDLYRDLITGIEYQRIGGVYGALIPAVPLPTTITNGMIADNAITNAKINAAAAIAKTKLGPLAIGDADISGTISPSKITGGVPKITRSAFSGGPPAGPVDGDIWIATGVDANNLRWGFQYNAGSASIYKWEFIGGNSLLGISTTNVSNGATLNTWINIVSGVISLSRAGEYKTQGSCTSNHPTAGATNYLDIYVGTTASAGVLPNAGGFPVAGGFSLPLVVPPSRVTIPAGSGVGMMGQSNVANGNWYNIGWEVLPYRIQ